MADVLMDAPTRTHQADARPVVNVAPAPVIDEPQVDTTERRRWYRIIGTLLMLNVALSFGSLHLLGHISLPLPFGPRGAEIATPVDESSVLTPDFASALTEAVPMTDSVIESSVAVGADALTDSELALPAPATGAKIVNVAYVGAPIRSAGRVGVDGGADSAGLIASFDADGSLVLLGSVPDKEALDAMIERVADQLPGGPSSVLGIVSEEAEASSDFASVEVPVGDPLLFDAGSSWLAMTHYVTLDLATSIAQSAPHVDVVVTGHASPEGATAYNLRLSTERVASVVTHFINAGIPEDRITTVAAGETPSVEEADYPQNRRVDIHLEGLFAEPEED